MVTSGLILILHAARCRGNKLRKRFPRRPFEIHHDLCCSQRQRLARPNEDWHARPPPRIDEEFGRDKCFNGRIGFDAGHRLIARILAANDMRRIERADRLQQGCFLFPNGIAFLACRRVHRQAGEHLQHVVLKHVADSASLIVEFTTVLDTKFLGHGDLNTVDVNAVPDRLEHGIRKSCIKNVLNLLGEQSDRSGRCFLLEKTG